jgi:hypothetical protein
MILVDTSIWINHFRVGDASLALMLDAGDVLIHPFVIGEIALGNLPNRGRVLGDLQGLPHVDIATHEEVLRLVSDKMPFWIGNWLDRRPPARVDIPNDRHETLDARQKAVRRRRADERLA